MMDLTELTTLLSTLLGVLAPLGGVGAFMYRRQNKRLKEAETQLAEINVTKGKVEAQSESWHIIKEQNDSLSALNQQLIERNQALVNMNAAKEDRHQEDIKDWQERFDKAVDRTREVQRENAQLAADKVELIKRNASLEARIAYISGWVCKDANCDHGIPPRDRLKGKTFKNPITDKQP